MTVCSTIMNLFKKIILLFFCASLALFTTGCGGKGSAGSSGLSPEELEVATVVESFSSAVMQKNRNDALANVLTTVKYYGGNAASHQGYNDLSNRLQNFFDNAGDIEFRIIGLGVTIESESLARARGQMILDYTTAGMPQSLTEQVEFKFEKDSRWGIVEIAGYGTSGTTTTQFPPAL